MTAVHTGPHTVWVRLRRHPSDVLHLAMWLVVAIVMLVFIEVAEDTSDGLAADLGRASARIPETLRELLLALVQVTVIVVPVVAVVVLLCTKHFHRTLMIALGAVAGVGAWVIVDQVFDVPAAPDHALTPHAWLASARFPSLAYVAAAAGALIVAKPWMTRAWRRAGDLAFVALVVTMALVGCATPAALLLALAVGFAAGAAVLLGFGAPDRRPSRDAIAQGLGSAGLPVSEIALARTHDGRCEIYEGVSDAGRLFMKIYDNDSRDADFLYRAWRSALFRGPYDAWPDRSLAASVEHEALCLVMAGNAGVRCPAPLAVVKLDDHSVVLAMAHVDGPTLAEAGEAIADAALDALWGQVEHLHHAGIAHRSLGETNVLLAPDGPALVDMGLAELSASEVLLAMDRAELLAATTTMVGVDRSVASAARSVPPDRLAASMSYLQPLALAPSTRRRVPKATLQQLRASVATSTGEPEPPVAQLSRVKARTLLMVAALAAAFYVLLPQLAHVGGSVTALRTADYWWMGVVLVMAAGTYLASAVNIAGAIPRHIPLLANVECQLAASFVNRVTPANVGGLALNLRFLQKAGVDAAEATSGLGLHVASGGLAHAILLVVFFAWAGQGEASFKLPDESKLLAAIAIVLAIVGLVLATRRGRRLVRERLLAFVKRSAASLAVLARWPAKLVMLAGGAFGMNLAYIAALAAAAAAYHAPVSFAQVGAIYLGASLIASAAPTPGGLGALEAALVAGFTGVGVTSADAVAIVLSYRLVTFWLPVLPGWLSFHVLERRGSI